MQVRQHDAPVKTSPHRAPLLRLSPAHVAIVKAAVNIAVVVGAYVDLRRVGNIFVGGCPWHESRSRRSFQVNPERGTWRCWSCAIGGDAIAFVRKFFDLTFQEAVAFLARGAGIALDVPVSPKLDEKVRLRKGLAEVQRRIDEGVRALTLSVSLGMASVRRLRRSAERRLETLHAGAKPRFDDECGITMEAISSWITNLRRLEAAFVILAHGEQILRERFAAYPQERETLVNEVLEVGFVVDGCGRPHEVPIAA